MNNPLFSASDAFEFILRSGCPNNCTIGECVNDRCVCPMMVNSTLYHIPPSNDCSLYGTAVYGSAWTSFQYSMCFMFGSISCLLGFYVGSAYYRYGVAIPFRYICIVMIMFALMCRFLYYAIDPYNVHHLLSPSISRLIFSLYYSLCILSYLTMMLQWIDICTQRLTKNITLYGSILVATFLIALQIAASVVEYKTHSYQLYMTIEFIGFSGAMLISIPIYIYYGHQFLQVLKKRPDKNGHKSQMIHKVLLITYGPSMASIVCFIVFWISSQVTRNDSELFLIGETISRSIEVATMLVFVAALVLPT